MFLLVRIKPSMCSKLQANYFLLNLLHLSTGAVFQEYELIIPTPPHHFCFLTKHRLVFFRWKQFGVLHVEGAEKKGQVGCSLEGCELKGWVLYQQRVTTKNFQVKFLKGRFLGLVFICNSSNDFRKKKYWFYVMEENILKVNLNIHIKY